MCFVLVTPPTSTCPHYHWILASWTSTPCSLPPTWLSCSYTSRSYWCVIIHNNNVHFFEVKCRCNQWCWGRATMQPHQHLQHIANWSHHTRGRPASAMLADSCQEILWIQLTGLSPHSPARGRAVCAEPGQRVVWSVEAPFHSVCPYWRTGSASWTRVRLRLVFLWDQARALRYAVMCNNNY